MKKIWHNRNLVGLCLLLIISNAYLADAQAFTKSAKSSNDAKTQVLKTKTQWEEFRVPSIVPDQAGLTSQLPDIEWWRSFKDSYLENYISAALQNNPTLHIAVARVAEARAAVRESTSQQLPTANLSSSYYHLTLPKLFGSSLPKNLSIWTIPFQASYEVDLFGKKLDQTQAAKRLLEASQQDVRAAQLSLCGEVASAYFNLLRSDALAVSQQRNLTLLTRIHELKQSQYRIGLTSYDEVIRADRDVAQAQTNLNTYQQPLASG